MTDLNPLTRLRVFIFPTIFPGSQMNGKNRRVNAQRVLSTKARYWNSINEHVSI